MAKRTRSIETDIFGYPVGQVMINSKNKGDSNERQATKWLYLWTGVRFIRTPSSGGRRLENASNFCGDVVCEDETFNFIFAVETKHLKKITFDPILRSNSAIFTIWEQAKRDADRAGKLPMLMLRENGRSIGSYMIYFSQSVHEKVKRTGAVVVSKGVNKDGGRIYGYTSDDLLEKISYEKLGSLI